MFTETLPATYYTEAEQKEIEAMYMGTESEARKRYQGNCSITSNELNLWIGDKDLFQEILGMVDMIQDQGMVDMIQDQDLTDSNHLEDVKNRCNVIDHDHIISL